MDSQADWNSRTDQDELALQYAQSYMAVRFLNETYGPLSGKDLVVEIGRGPAISDSIKTVTGLDLAVFESWRQEEQVALMRELWANEAISYEGRWHRVTGAGINPRPERQIPIWFGGSHPAVLRRAARIMRGFLERSTIPDGAAVVCIGPITAATASELGLEVAAVAAKYTEDGLIDALEKLFADG